MAFDSKNSMTICMAKSNQIKYGPTTLHKRPPATGLPLPSPPLGGPSSPHLLVQARSTVCRCSAWPFQRPGTNVEVQPKEAEEQNKPFKDLEYQPTNTRKNISERIKLKFTPTTTPTRVPI